jgi:predicted hotdog family 3-hydroxylacyl-ACP dehydratase
MTPTHDIFSWIPQRPPFVFIDTVVEADGNCAVTQFTITETCPLVEAGHLSLAGLMENAAQTCAVRAGVSGGNRIGFIGAVKQMETKRFPSVGEILTTRAVLVQEVLNISLIECTVSAGGELIATATLKLAIVD